MTVLNHEWDVLLSQKASITASEIENQPQIWRKLAVMLNDRLDDLYAFMQQVMSVEGLRVVFTGAGSSAFIGESMSMLLMGECGLRSDVVHTTEAVATPEECFYDVPTLLVSYSRSGSSPESCAAINTAAKYTSKLYNLVLVCNADSVLAKMPLDPAMNRVVNIPQEASDQGFAMTCSVSCMSLATWVLFAPTKEEAKKRINYLYTLAEAAEKQIPVLQQEAAKIAAFDYRRIVYLGFGALRGLAREGAVKSQELTNGFVCACYDTPTGFRHGPKTVLNDETLVVLMTSPMQLAGEYDKDMIHELSTQRTPNHVVVTAREDLPYAIDEADYPVRYVVPAEYHLSEMNAYIFSLLFLQILSFEKSFALKITTDNPCPNGEVNRVVQGVLIH